MTVKELIEELTKVENKDAKVIVDTFSEEMDAQSVTVAYNGDCIWIEAR